MNPPSVLDAREERWRRRVELFAEYRLPVVSVTLAVPGPDKTGRGVVSAHRKIAEDFLAAAGAALGGEPRFREDGRGADGPFAFFVAAASAEAVKRAAVDFEETHPIGRLADVDVLAERPLSRADLGLPARKCLLCGEDAAVCVRSAAHSRAEVRAEFDRRVEAFFADLYAAEAVRAMLWELSASPKPGLVDRFDSGAHRDMDYFTFIDSVAALAAPLREIFVAAYRFGDGPDAELFPLLREIGRRGEKAMFAATSGVNTQKGLLFSFSALFGALGRLVAEGTPPALDALLGKAASLSAPALGDLEGIAAGGTGARLTAGERLYLKSGALGIRGEAASGFPTAARIGLPALRSGLAAGLSRNDALVDALLALLAEAEDTNVLSRGGTEGLAFVRRKALEAIEAGGVSSAGGKKLVGDMNRLFIERNLSPGGCADLLAISAFLHNVVSQKIL